MTVTRTSQPAVRLFAVTLLSLSGCGGSTSGAGDPGHGDARAPSDPTGDPRAHSDGGPGDDAGGGDPRMGDGAVSCAGFDCSGHGSCSTASGSPHCTCTAGYDGLHCAGCADGYQDNDHDGTCSSTCATSMFPCTTHYLCDDTSGTARCRRDDWGFWDEGLLSPTTRTMYDAQNEGTAANPLVIEPCLYAQPDPILINPAVCNAAPAVYSTANAWTNGVTWPTDDYWVLLMNNEPAFNTCNPGPPDASLARANPGAGIMGYSAQTDGGVLRAHLVLNHTFANPCAGAIPFLSVGAHQWRGNHGRPVMAIHPNASAPGPAPTHLQFVATLWDIGIVDTDVGATYLWTLSEWPRGDGTMVPRLLFLALGTWSRIPGWGDNDRVHRHWNWPIAEDVLEPGADIAFVSTDSARLFCGLDLPTLYSPTDHPNGRVLTYDVDVSALYDCAGRLGLWDEPVPSGLDLPVRGVFWANELARPNSWIWTSVHGLRTYRTPCGATCQPGEACTGTSCRCGSGAGCGAGHYCYAGSTCLALPTLTGDPVCADIGSDHPSPDYLARYTIHGRPGATASKYNRHISCASAPDTLAPESPFVLDGAGNATYVIGPTAASSDCAHEALGKWESWAVVDGHATNLQPTIYYNHTCPAVATCQLAAGFCPP